ncbi:hypothetical protein ASA1KI_23240 [Opitutales bacterium ASA1]|uniref:hypothetical protein n=1 Tax=Congregicoccus parvus TaxID=3081749 RepID=UPI002B2962D7|nr:hypothetical protein ASA1KI_23240 [Opitutales bacterium ASA1]
MRVLNQIVAIVLLALWVPATLHCAFGSVTGLQTKLCEEACKSTGGTHEGACSVVESGDYTAAANLPHVPMPNLSTVVWLACLHSRLLYDARPLAPPAWAADHPREWVPVWAFVQRAAPLSRAPSRVG